MREYGFSLTRILPYKDKSRRFCPYAGEIRVSEKPYSRIFHTDENSVRVRRRGAYS